jgi:hypothetical protein
LVLLTGVANFQPGPVNAAEVGEYPVKAAMIYNLATFVDWPADASHGPGMPLTLCMIGKGPLGAALEELRGKKAKGRQLALKTVTRNDEWGACQMLVVNAGDKHTLAAIIAGIEERDILTVSDLPHFAEAGGMVGLVATGGKVRLEVNLEATQRSRLKISAQLLRLARIVTGGE